MILISNERKGSKLQLFILYTLLPVVRKAFVMNKKPFPWQKALTAAICAGVPVITGMLAGQTGLGFLGGIGSFTYLYVFNEPYAQRAKKIFLVAVGMALAVALGTLSAPYPFLVVIMVGFIGAVGTFVFGVFNIPGPAAIFFILGFIMTTSMPIDPSLAPVRTAVVFASGCFSWLMSMAGWFWSPHGREINEVKDVYSSLRNFSETVGSIDINDSRHRMVEALQESKETLAIGYIPWKDSVTFNRLYNLNEQANKLFLQMLEIHFKAKNRLPSEFIIMLKKLSQGIELKEGYTIELEPISPELAERYRDLYQIILETAEIINEPSKSTEYEVEIAKPSLSMTLMKAIDKDSIVFINAVRYGLVLSIATAIAFSFTFTRPYWIPLSCASVMMGSTIMSTFHRSIQRSTGTVVGILFASMVLSLHQQGFVIVGINMALTLLTELFIVKNYAVAAIFITPNAILMAENSTKIYNISYFASARVTDILIGSAIGLIGTYIIGRSSASSRLSGLASKLIRSQERVLVRLAGSAKGAASDPTMWIKEKMNINLTNFKMAYRTALGEVPNDVEMLEIMWPAYTSLEHISYLLESVCMGKGYLEISDEDLAQLLLVLETMATAVEQSQPVQPKKIPIIEGVHKICEEINMLQEALSIKIIR
jgi:uncharacterized membrane protein YccC